MTFQVVTTKRLVKAILDLLGRGCQIDRVREDRERPDWFLIEAHDAR